MTRPGPFLQRVAAPLQAPGADPPVGHWVYQVALPLQLSPVQAALFVNIRRGGFGTIDFAAGSDLATFDRLDPTAVSLQPLHRGRAERDREGRDWLYSAYTMRGGSIPPGRPAR